MTAQIKRLHSPDIDDLASYYPEDEECFGFLLQAIAGPRGLPGEESFDMIVCTPQWLIKQHRHEDVVVGRSHLIVFEYDFKRLSLFLERYAERCSGHTWREVAEKLSRLGNWEFQDYDAGDDYSRG